MDDSLRQLLKDQATQLQQAINDEKQRRAFIHSLRFEMIKAREETISEHYKSTFQWIFDESINHDAPPSGHEHLNGRARPWDNFADWLKTGSGVYWISGKPGSGKSTLMNYVYDEKRTRQFLQHWAGDHELLTPTFYFWSAGGSEQKNINGFLRSLAYQILNAKSILASSLMEFHGLGKGRSSERNGSIALPEWTNQRLTKTIKFLVQQKLYPIRICFFLDGLDEFDGRYVDLLQLVRDMDVTETVKFCVSSRPEHAFEEAFESTPQMRLQDLTYDDITSLVKDRFENSQPAADLMSTHQTRTETLRQVIVDKSHGVFLWVILVVTDLIEEMEAGGIDSIEQLEERVRLLPVELHDLYFEMCNKLPPIYRKEASRLLRLMLCNSSMRDISDFEGPMFVSSFAIAEHVGLVDDFKKPLSMQQVTRCLAAQNKILISKCREMATQLQTRCAGLLKVGHRTSKPADPRLEGGDLRVDFVHRSAFEFLTETQKGGEFLDMTPQSRLEAIRAHITRLICSTILVEASSQSTDAGDSISGLLELEYNSSRSHRRGTYIGYTYTQRDLLQVAVFRAISYASLAPSTFGESQTSHLNHFANLTDLEFVLKSLGTLHASELALPGALPAQPLPLRAPAGSPSGAVDFAWYMPMEHPDIRGSAGPAKEFLGLTATQDSGAYASSKIGDILNHPDPHFKDYLMSCVLFGGVFPNYDSSKQCNLIIDLLQAGVDPNSVVQNRPHRDGRENSGGGTLWHSFLSRLCAMRAVEKLAANASLLSRIVKAFIDAGADLNGFVLAITLPPCSVSELFNVVSKRDRSGRRDVVTVYQDLTPLSYLHYFKGTTVWYPDIVRILAGAGARFGRCIGSILAKRQMFSDIADADKQILMEALADRQSIRQEDGTIRGAREEFVVVLDDILTRLYERDGLTDEEDGG